MIAATLLLSGCAATLNGYDVAANGLPRTEDALRRDLAYEPDRAYEALLEGEDGLPDDDLLRLLFAATAGHEARAHSESCQLLDLASYLAEDRVTTSVSQQALSMVTSDRALDYVPGRTERLMIHYTAALAFLEAGDAQGAAVEARRIEAMLDRLGEAGTRDGVSDDARFLHLLAATTFEAAGDRSAAEVAYRRAGVEAAGAPPADGTGEVVVLVERGFVPHRVEQSVVIVLPAPQVENLAEGDAGERAAAATDAAARILLTAASHYGDRSAYYHDHGWRRPIRLAPWECDDCDGTDADPYLLRISWPVLYQDRPPGARLRVRVGELGVDPIARLDVSAGVRRDFDRHRPTMIARTVARAASKAALSLGAKEMVAEKDEAAGEVVGFLTNLGTLLTERADTRSWHLLPGSVSMIRLRLPAGTHQLALEAGTGSGATGMEGIALGPVEVREGGTTVVSHRLWR